MPQPTFLGNEDLLELIIEKQFEIISLQHNTACSVTSVTYYQEWIRYHSMLKKPIYVNLVKEFWKYAYLNHENSSISSYVYDIPITIKPFSITLATGCENTGVTVDFVKSRSLMSEKFPSLHDCSSRYEPMNPENLLPIPKAWFKLVLSNFLPRGINQDLLRYDDQVFIYLLMNDTRVNLPQSIFNYLWKSIYESRNQTKSYIPFGRVLYEIFIQDELVDLITEDGLENYPENCLLKTNCDVFRG